MQNRYKAIFDVKQPGSPRVFYPGDTFEGHQVASDQKGVDYLVRVGAIEPIVEVPAAVTPLTAKEKAAAEAAQ